MEKPAISIIVPIFNMEWCMRKCIDSILSQTFTDFECLLIDDGSTDSSPAICDEYAQKDSRILVFHKPNGGLSDARNYGLEKAQGEYTIFADSDDWVDADGLDQLYQKAKETDADMAMCDLYYNDLFQQTYYKQEPTSNYHLDILKDLFTGKVKGFTVTKLIKRDIYVNYSIYYPQGMYGCEDLYTMSELLTHDVKVTYIPIAFYHYMHYGVDSLSRHYDKMTYLHDQKIRDLFVKLIDNYPDLKIIVWNTKTIDIVIRAFKYGSQIFNDKQFQKEFYSYRNLVKSSNVTTIERLPTLLSCYGCYHVWNWIFWKGFKVKQIIKKIKWNLRR